MTLDQGLAFAILGGMIVLFLSDRFRYDVVAVIALAAALAAGIVPMDKAFSGFSDPIVIIVAGALVVSAAVSASGVVDAVIRWLMPATASTTLQVALLTSSVTALSALMKNIGAVAIFLPVAFQLARRTGTPPSTLLMPIAFGSLLGGLVTMIGTSPNIVVARIRQDLVGEPFGMFDFTPVGAGVAVAGVVFLSFGWRLIPRGRRGQASPENAFRIEDYSSEARLPPDSAFVGRTVADLEALGEGDLTVSAVVRETFRRYVPAGNWVLLADDILVLECDPHVLKKVVDRADLELVGSRPLGEERTDGDDIAVVEAVVTADSPMVGCTIVELRLRERHLVNLLAVGRRGHRLGVRLHRVRFRAGDVVVLQGIRDAMPDTLDALGCLPLAPRNLKLGRPRKVVLPLLILAVAMAAVAAQLVPVEIAFFGASVAVIVTRLLPLNEIYEAVDWPILVMLGALIPVSDAVRTTGGTDLIAGWLSAATGALPPAATLTLIMVSAMLVTPFLNNAATVLVMAPIAATFAVSLKLNPDAFLMAVAIGAACDFLTPIGHQCNTLVLGPGGYKFSDYWRLGLPLSAIVVLTAVPLIMIVWPL